jgi:hypothetical protein
MKNELIVELRVMGFDCHPSEITKLLKLQPTSTWIKGELVSKSGRGIKKNEENGWALRADWKSTEQPIDFSDLFDDLSKRVFPVKERFAELSKESSIQVACCAYIREYAPAFTLDEPTIRLLADINASVDFDIYCLVDS